MRSDLQAKPADHYHVDYYDRGIAISQHQTDCA